MANKKTVRGILVMALVLGIAAAGYSFDLSSFPDPIEKGSLLVSPGFGFGTFYPGVASGTSAWLVNSTLLSGTVAVDYALPINFGLTVGGEIGLSGSKLKGAWVDPNMSFLGIPLIARIAWHPNFEIRNLDLYLLMKLGWDIGFWAGDNTPPNNPNGFIYGFNVGGRYFFTPSIGAFLEGGYEYHFLRYKQTIGSWTYTYPSFGAKFITFGATFKVGR
jgi:hypothetical protein